MSNFILERNIKELNLSSAAYMLLISNGIKNISSLTTYTKEELLNLKISYKKYSTRDAKETLVNEIINKLSMWHLKLNTKKEIEKIPTERRIKELNLSNSVSRRLINRGIVTLGNLSILNERNIKNIYGIGDKALNEIKNVMEEQKDISLGTEYSSMIVTGLTEEEVEYYIKEKKKLDIEDNEYIKDLSIREQEQKERNIIKKYVFSLKVKDILITTPIFRKEIITDDLTIGDITSFSRDDIINSDEINAELRGLKIGLHLGMNYSEKEKLTLTESDIKDLRIIALERRVKRLEDENRRLNASNNYFYFKQKK